MQKNPDMDTYSKVFTRFWAIWKHYGVRHTDSEAWEKVVALSDEIMKLVPEDETMHEITRLLLNRLEERANELKKGANG